MRRISLSIVLTGGLLGAIAVTVAVIQTSTWLTTRDVLVSHARTLMNDVALGAIERTGAFLEPAQVTADLTAQLLDSAVVNGDDAAQLERYFFEQLRIHPQLAGIYYGTERGDFIFVKRDRNRVGDGTRTKLIHHRDGVRSVENIWRRDDFTEIERQFDADDPYDPRSRPWYRDALRAASQVWTEPYIFYTSQQPGITTAVPLYADDAGLKGVVGVDIEIGEISTFLRDLRISPHGSAFIVNRSGELLAHPDSARVTVREWTGTADTLRFARIDELNDPLLTDAYHALPEPIAQLGMGERAVSEFTRDGQRYMVEFATFPDGGWPWVIGLYAPEDDFLGAIKSNQLVNLALSLLIGCVVGAVGWLISRSVTRTVRALRNEALRIPGATLIGRSWPVTPIRELAETIDAFRGMEMSLLHEREERVRLTAGLRKTSLETMMRMAVVAEYKDASTAAHIERMSLFCHEIASHFDFSEARLEELRCAAMMHDIGKVGVPDKILQKPGPLDVLERRAFMAHPEAGAEILKDSDSEVIELARVIALTHHERWDGSGYPYGLKGEMVPLVGRISAVADVFDALISERCYKQGMSVDAAVEIIREGSGSQFDPRVVDAFIDAYDGIVTILRDHPVGSQPGDAGLHTVA